MQTQSEIRKLYRLNYWETATCPTCGVILLTQFFDERGWIFYCFTCEKEVRG
jgi:hypothetical protein